MEDIKMESKFENEIENNNDKDKLNEKNQYDLYTNLLKSGIWTMAGRIWIVISIPFVAIFLWQSLEQDFYRRGIDMGVKKTKEVIYADLIKKASNSECNSIFVQQEEQRVDLISLTCLKKLAKVNIDKKTNLKK